MIAKNKFVWPWFLLSAVVPPCFGVSNDPGANSVDAASNDGETILVESIDFGSDQAPEMVGCTIDGHSYAEGAEDPSNPCRICKPALTTTEWSDASRGTLCGGALFCVAGRCGSVCVIGGQLYGAGEVNPDNPCQNCTPANSVLAWSTVGDGVSCGSGGKVCTQAACLCPSQQHDCGGTCVPNDVNACGDSCTACVAPSHASVACNLSACVITCDPLYKLENGACVACQPGECLPHFWAFQGRGLGLSCTTNADCDHDPEDHMRCNTIYNVCVMDCYGGETGYACCAYDSAGGYVRGDEAERCGISGGQCQNCAANNMICNGNYHCGCGDSPYECPWGTHCDSTMTSYGRCVAGCNSDDGHCPFGTICSGVACVSGCRTDNGCSIGSYCSGSVCVPGCHSDYNCGFGSYCSGSVCVAGCHGDYNCPIETKCQGSACVEGCSSDARCSLGKSCQSSHCLPEPACSRDQDCRAAECCRFIMGNHVCTSC